MSCRILPELTHTKEKDLVKPGWWGTRKWELVYPPGKGPNTIGTRVICDCAEVMVAEAGEYTGRLVVYNKAGTRERIYLKPMPGESVCVWGYELGGFFKYSWKALVIPKTRLMVVMAQTDKIYMNGRTDLTLTRFETITGKNTSPPVPYLYLTQYIDYAFDLTRSAEDPLDFLVAVHKHVGERIKVWTPAKGGVSSRRPIRYGAGGRQTVIRSGTGWRYTQDTSILFDLCSRVYPIQGWGNLEDYAEAYVQENHPELFDRVWGSANIVPIPAEVPELPEPEEERRGVVTSVKSTMGIYKAWLETRYKGCDNAKDTVNNKVKIAKERCKSMRGPLYEYRINGAVVGFGHKTIEQLTQEIRDGKGKK